MIASNDKQRELNRYADDWRTQRITAGDIADMGTREVLILAQALGEAANSCRKQILEARNGLRETVDPRWLVRVGRSMESYAIGFKVAMAYLTGLGDSDAQEVWDHLIDNMPVDLVESANLEVYG